MKLRAQYADASRRFYSAAYYFMHQGTWEKLLADLPTTLRNVQRPVVSDSWQTHHLSSLAGLSNLRGGLSRGNRLGMLRDKMELLSNVGSASTINIDSVMKKVATAAGEAGIASSAKMDHIDAKISDTRAKIFTRTQAGLGR